LFVFTASNVLQMNSGELSTVHWVGLELGQTKMVWTEVWPSPKKKKNTFGATSAQHLFWAAVGPTPLGDFGPSLSWVDLDPISSGLILAHLG
jgi:hypothetical protein